MTLPQPWFIRNHGFMLMFSKATGGRELYFTTSPDGKTWAESQKLAGFGGHDQVSFLSENKLVTAFTYHPGGDSDKRTNLYVLKSEDMGKSWTTIAGDQVNIPLDDIDNKALVKDYQAENKLVHIIDLNFDKDGNPVILILISNNQNPGPAGGPREWLIVHWKENKWHFNKVCESTHNFDLGSLYISGNEWKIIGPTEPGPQKYGTGGELALWISSDEGIEWKKIRNITEKSTYNNSFVRRPLNSHKDFYALWTDGNAYKFSVSRLFFTNARCDKVWMLPYNMSKKSARPQLVK